jgi:CheY-like chemotaxis protein
MASRAILIVDDEAILLMSLRQSLRLQFGATYRYETALSGPEGLECIAELAADGIQIVLVISDWVMPGMNGDEFLGAVHARYPDIKLIMLTGHADEAEMARLASEVELVACLRKPWEPARLFDAIKSAVL